MSDEHSSSSASRTSRLLARNAWSLGADVRDLGGSAGEGASPRDDYGLRLRPPSTAAHQTPPIGHIICQLIGYVHLFSTGIGECHSGIREDLRQPKFRLCTFRLSSSLSQRDYYEQTRTRSQFDQANCCASCTLNCSNSLIANDLARRRVRRSAFFAAPLLAAVNRMGSRQLSPLPMRTAAVLSDKHYPLDAAAVTADRATREYSRSQSRIAGDFSRALCAAR